MDGRSASNTWLHNEGSGGLCGCALLSGEQDYQTVGGEMMQDSRPDPNSFVVAYLNAAIAETKQRIRDHIDNHPDLKHKKELLETIPGIGEATINVVLSEFSDISRFDNAKKLASFIGLAPRHRLSGTSVRGRSSMSKVGNGQIRKALLMPAMVAMKYNPVLIQMRERLLAAGKSKMLIVGAAMRKLVHIIYGVLKNDRPFNPHFAEVKA